MPNKDTGLVSEQNSSLDTLWSTVEPVDLVEKAYPNLVSSYLDTISAKSKKSSKLTRANSKNGPSQVAEIVQKNSVNQDPIIIDNGKVNHDAVKVKKPTKKSKNQKDDGKTKQIDKYFKKVKILPALATPKSKPKIQPPKPQAESPKIKTCSTPLNLTELSFDFNNSHGDDIHDLSDIIQGIVSNSPTITDICGRKLYYENANQPTQRLHSFKSTTPHGKDETADEFDMIVAGIEPLRSRNDTNTPTTSRKKTKKRSVDKRSSSKHVETPILITKFFKRNRIEHKASVLTSSTPTASPENLTENESFKSISTSKDNGANVSYFFGDITDEHDVFEKLTDFRNMEDVCPTNEDYAEEACHGDELQENNDSPGIELSDTFDLDDYVPVGAHLRQRLAL